MEPLFIKNNISINSSPSNVWDSLINPEKTKSYMFGYDKKCPIIMVKSKVQF
jgi:carbon monoxide dehydrogenase subunit G